MGDVLRLGMIGLSPGNGHPYSWSAICNGYDPGVMEDCGFPGIPRYLERRRFPADQIQGARVVSVWTQSPEISRHIAAAALIPDVANRPEDMIGQVDAVLLARDDADRHLEMAAPFLDAGLPVFIDKPLATDVASARAILARQTRPGQIFTCTALRFLDTLQVTPEHRRRLGRVDYVDAIVFNDWGRYAVHVVEPVLAAFPERGAMTSARMFRAGAGSGVTVEWASGPTMTFTATGSSETPVSIRLFGVGGTAELAGTDNFVAFRAALERFCAIVRGEAEPFAEEFVLDVVAVIEAGL